MKAIELILALCLVLILLFSVLLGREAQPKSLEIYTPDEIIYISINSKIVTFETSAEVKHFNEWEDLKEYISDITAEQSY